MMNEFKKNFISKSKQSKNLKARKAQVCIDEP